MLKTMRFIGVVAAALLALPALAGSWPPTPPRKAAKVASPAIGAPATQRGAAALDGFEPAAGESGWQLVQPRYVLSNGRFTRVENPRAAIVAVKIQPAPSGYEYIGGDAGWALSQHKYVFAGGRLKMSEECDHVIRVVQAPAPAEIETARKLSPGT